MMICLVFLLQWAYHFPFLLGLPCRLPEMVFMQCLFLDGTNLNDTCEQGLKRNWMNWKSYPWKMLFKTFSLDFPIVLQTELIMNQFTKVCDILSKVFPLGIMLLPAFCSLTKILKTLDVTARILTPPSHKSL